MSFVCPGYLNAKSLQEGGENRDDYVEWFSSPELALYQALIDSVYGTMQYRGDDPVLLTCDISSESCLLFRFTMKSQDRKGRKHQRCEVLKVERSNLPALLNGEFKAAPDLNAKVFIVDAIEGEALPQCRRHYVKNEMLCVYARNPQAYWFRNGEPVSVRPPRKEPSNESKRPVRQGRTVNYPKEKNSMNKVLFVLLTVSCALGGWFYFQIDCLYANLAEKDKEISKLQAENSKLQADKCGLKKKMEKYDKWLQTRNNFELNKTKLKNKFDEIAEKFHEAENLWVHIDEVPSQTSKYEEFKTPSGALKSKAGTSSPRVGKNLSFKDGQKADLPPAPSSKGTPKSEDKEKEKSFFAAPLEKIKNMLPDTVR